MLQNFNTDTSAILQGITMTSLALRPSGHREYLDRDFLLISVVYFQRKVQCWTNLTNSSKWRQDRRWCFTNTSAILQAITVTSLQDIGNILIVVFYWFHSLIFNGKLSVEQIWQTKLKQFFFTNNSWHDDVLRTLINHSVFSMASKKIYFKKIIVNES
jgi:hypothetical protein